MLWDVLVKFSEMAANLALHGQKEKSPDDL